MGQDVGFRATTQPTYLFVLIYQTHVIVKPYWQIVRVYKMGQQQLLV